MTRSKVGEERDAQTEQEVTICDVGNYRNNDNKFFFPQMLNTLRLFCHLIEVKQAVHLLCMSNALVIM